MMDPTYNQEEIKANPVWARAFYISEMENDLAPIGWSNYISRAKKEIEESQSKTRP
jgi:hypothetical protein